jgi:hypothetical protein
VPMKCPSSLLPEPAGQRPDHFFERYRTVGAGLAVVAAIALTTPWLLYVADQADTRTDRARERIEAVRTGLAAGAGVGVAAGLLLAFRRHHHQQLATALADQDATEKRITELFPSSIGRCLLKAARYPVPCLVTPPRRVGLAPS